MFLFEEQLLESSNGKGTLTQDSLLWWQNSRQQILNLKDVVGVSALTNNHHSTSFLISSYPLVKGYFRKPRRILQEQCFSCPSIAARSRWVQTISTQLHPKPFKNGHRHLHIVINPYSGQKKANRFFRQIKLLFDKSKIRYTLSETKGIGDAQQQAKQLDLSCIDGLVVVGGDGTIHEVVNGLMSREDWQIAIATPIGIIPAGTGNGLCKSLLELAGEPYDLLSAAFMIAKGQYSSIDLGLVEQNDRRYYSLLSVAWALPSDVDIQSEKLRYLGSLRNIIYALWKICSLRSYSGQFYFLMQTDSGFATWQSLPGKFVLFWAMNSAWATLDLKIAPLASLNDGIIDVLIIREGISRFRLLYVFLCCAIGWHWQPPEIEYYRVSEFILEPLTSESKITIDGEIFQPSTFKFSMGKQLVNFFFVSQLPIN